jgi:23S rRNA pseudouridine1911/1915/1917 synthase
MGKMLQYTIEKKDENKKLVNYLKFELKFSTRLTRKLIRNGCVAINDLPGRGSSILHENDRIIIDLESDETQDIEPQEIPLDVVYEDDDLLIVNKSPFMVVHPTRSHPDNTLANAVMNYFKITKQNCIVRLVNRIDRDTSGLVVIAKSQYSHQAMAKKLDNNEIDKFYIAVVEGKLQDSGVIDMPIDRPFEDSVKRAVTEDGYRAVTHYEVLYSNESMSIVLIKLETGKTHQIRVHMSHIGHPLLGDTLYGTESCLINRQALHAYKLKFRKLRTDEECEITAEIPEDIVKLINMVNKQ